MNDNKKGTRYVLVTIHVILCIVCIGFLLGSVLSLRFDVSFFALLAFVYNSILVYALSE